jgi:NAD(P)-dependent dehydrogenase (short-subunit alcohol dehydrogenase family)
MSNSRVPSGLARHANWIRYPSVLTSAWDGGYISPGNTIALLCRSVTLWKWILRTSFRISSSGKHMRKRERLIWQFPLSKLEEVKTDEWNRMIDVNIRGVLHGIAAALPVMKRQRHGHFVNLSSIGGHAVYPTSAVYSATKFAVIAISEGLRQENDYIRVTVVSPGVTESELADSISDAGAREVMKEFRRIALPAEAVARSIAFAIDQPHDVDVNEIIVRPTASSN